MAKPSEQNDNVKFKMGREAASQNFSFFIFHFKFIVCPPEYRAACGQDARRVAESNRPVSADEWRLQTITPSHAEGSRLKQRPHRSAVRLPKSFISDGFTLLEIVVSFGIFFSVIVVAIGAVLAISNAQIKASNFQVIQDDLRFALEFMTKEIRAGTNFSASSGTGCPPICGQINFTHARSDGTPENIGYCLRSGAVKRIYPGASGCDDVILSKPITSSEITVDGLKFYLVQGVKIQPRVSVVVSAVSNNPKFPSSFRMETTVTQRYRP